MSESTAEFGGALFGMTRCWRLNSFQLVLASTVLIGGAIAIFGDCAFAQIAPDGTLPNNSIVTPSGNTSLIEGGTQAGSNLFHSFEQFSIPTGGVAYFNNALDIQNIFSRVTGKSISNIDGLIQANGTANLFLLNPNGIIFGPNASLSIGGSILVSTASAIKFADGTQFSASALQTTPLLTVSVPIGLQYGETVGSILNQSQATDSSGEAVGLQVPPGKTLALVGGDVSMDGGRLKAPGGRVELGGVASSGTVGLNVDDNNLRLSFPNAVARTDVSLTNEAGVDVAAGGGGSIAINAQDVDVLGGSLLYSGIETGLGSVDSQAGDITLNATEAVTVANSFIYNYLNSGAVGNTGNLTIETGRLSLSDGAQIGVSTDGEGNTGNLIVRASDLVELNGEGRKFVGLGTQVNTQGKGNAGNLIVETGRLKVSEGAEVSASTFGEGDAGDLTVRATEVELIGRPPNEQFSGGGLYSQVNPGATGNGGNLTVETGRLIMQDGAQVSAATSGAGTGGNLVIATRQLIVQNGSQITASTFGVGPVGTLKVRASESIELIGKSVDGQFAGSGLFNQVNAGATGAGGNLTVETGRLIVRDGAQIQAGTLGSGSAGTLAVRAFESVELRGTSAFDSQVVSGLLTSVLPGATGNGGNLTVETGRLIVWDGAQIQAGTFGEGAAGSLVVRASESAEVIGRAADGRFGSALATSVQAGATGAGGNLTVETGRLIIQDGAFVSAATLGSGSAGTLAVRASESVEVIGESADGQFPSELTTVVSLGATGAGGNLTVETGRLIMQGGAQISAATSGSGSAGTLAVRAFESVELRGTSAFDNQIASGLFTSVQPEATGNGGNLTVETGRLIVRDGAGLSSGTLGKGSAGTLTVKARESVELIGTTAGGQRPSLLTSETNGTGSAGDLKIETKHLNVRDGALVTVSSEESGKVGNLTVQARDLLLDNQGRITATTRTGNGGDITLQAQDLLLLRHESNISTRAGTEQTSGTGGNITIDTDNLVALENSDIDANAFGGRGGQVRINANGIFGTQGREQQTPESDITASSNLGPQFSGIVEINTPDVDPAQGLIELPAVPVDTEVAQGCTAGGTVAKSEFIITGRGGLPPNPGDSLSTDAVQVDLITLNPEIKNRSSAAPSTDSTRVSAITQIVEAQGWVINNKGEVMLTATAPNATPHNPWIPSATCHTPQASS